MEKCLFLDVDGIICLESYCSEWQLMVLEPNKHELVTQESHRHTEKLYDRRELGQRSKKRAFITADSEAKSK